MKKFFILDTLLVIIVVALLAEILVHAKHWIDWFIQHWAHPGLL